MSAAATSPAPVRRPTDAGVSLAELLVAIMVFGIVMAVATSTFISLTRATSQSRSIDTATRQATNGMDSMARVVRSASNNPVPNSAAPTPAFSVAGVSELTLISSVNLTGSTTKPQLTTYRVDPATRGLVESTTQSVGVSASASSTFWQFTGATTSRVLASPVRGTATPLFRYYDVGGAEILPAATGYLTDAQEKSIASVSITLTVGRADSATAGVTLSTVAVLSNLFPSAVTP